MGNAQEADSINRAFRESDWMRWQQIDFVVGFEIHRSNNPCEGCELCERLTGKYPKSFIWHGWHDDCKCFTTSILEDYDTMRENRVARIRANINKTEYTPKEASNTIKYVPKTLLVFFAENYQTMCESNTVPYYINDNLKLILSSYEYYKNN